MPKKTRKEKIKIRARQEKRVSTEHHDHTRNDAIQSIHDSEQHQTVSFTFPSLRHPTPEVARTHQNYEANVVRDIKKDLLKTIILAFLACVFIVLLSFVVR